MPTYEYRCRTCDAHFEVRQSFSEDSLTRCPSAAGTQSPTACVAPGEGEVRKIFSAPSITFKGDGFYKTDSRSSSRRSTNGGDGKAPTEDTSKASEATKDTSEGGTSSATKQSSDSAGGTKASDRTPADATSS